MKKQRTRKANNPVGEGRCEFCGKKFTKLTQWHRFCKSKCRMLGYIVRTAIEEGVKVTTSKWTQ